MHAAASISVTRSLVNTKYVFPGNRTLPTGVVNSISSRYKHREKEDIQFTCVEHIASNLVIRVSFLRVFKLNQTLLNL